jgi:hypothetical protein
LNVESMLACAHINHFFIRGEEVEEQSPESGGMENSGDLSVAWAVPTAPAAVGKDNDPT